jgi:hypothetical protein
MVRSFSEWIHKISSGRVVLLTIFVMLLFVSIVLPNQAEKSLQETGSARSPDTSFFYQIDELYQIAEEYGEEGRQAYIRSRWTFDLLFPLVYTAFLTVGVSWFLNQSGDLPQVWRLSNLLPILGCGFDYLENGAASWLMAIYPEKLTGLAQATAALSLLKWVLIGMAFLVYFLSAISIFASWIKKRKVLDS